MGRPHLPHRKEGRVSQREHREKKKAQMGIERYNKEEATRKRESADRVWGSLSDDEQDRRRGLQRARAKCMRDRKRLAKEHATLGLPVLGIEELDALLAQAQAQQRQPPPQVGFVPLAHVIAPAPAPSSDDETPKTTTTTTPVTESETTTTPVTESETTTATTPVTESKTTTAAIPVNEFESTTTATPVRNANSTETTVVTTARRYQPGDHVIIVYHNNWYVAK
jgi:hypothetical protein